MLLAKQTDLKFYYKIITNIQIRQVQRVLRMVVFISVTLLSPQSRIMIMKKYRFKTALKINCYKMEILIKRADATICLEAKNSRKNPHGT